MSALYKQFIQSLFTLLFYFSLAQFAKSFLIKIKLLNPNSTWCEEHPFSEIEIL